MKKLNKIGLLLFFLVSTSISVFAQGTDALIITPQGNVNVVHGKVQEGGNDLMPKGAIIMWYGDEAKIPKGWALCNGKNGTPNLIDKFVIGAGGQYKTPLVPNNSVGGQESVTLTEANLPKHHHNVNLKTSSDGNHSHLTDYYNYNYSSKNGYYDAAPLYYKLDDLSQKKEVRTSESGAHTHSVVGETDKSGLNAPFDNRPPFYALFYIMKL